MSSWLRATWLVALALVVGSATGCTLATNAAPSSSATAGPVAEADLYSGRENPTWSLDSDVAGVVAECVRTAAATSARVASPAQGLGFRGIVVRGITVDGDEGGSLRALPGTTTFTAHGEDYTVRSCPTLYPALRESARAHLSADELDLIPKGTHQ